MNKIPPLGSEGRQLISENPPIPLCPNIPSSREDYLRKNGKPKSFLAAQAISKVVWLG